MSDTPMIEKIRKLFAKAESTTSPHEAEALLGKAYEMLAKYGIEETTARADNNSDASQIGKWAFTPKGKYRNDQVILLSQVALALHCTAVKHHEGYVLVFGAKRHLDRVEMLTGMLVAYMVATAGKSKSYDPRVSTVTYRKSVMLGFAVEVRDRLKAAEKAAVEETDDQTGVSVVLQSDFKRAQQFMNDQLGRLSSSSVVRRSSVGVAEGRSAARSVDLGGSNRVSGRRAISA